MITKSDVAYDVRVRREAETLAQNGHQVTVIGLGTSYKVNGVDVIGLRAVDGLTGKRPTALGPFYQSVRWMLLPQHRLAADKEFTAVVGQAWLQHHRPIEAVHAHDRSALHSALEIAETENAPLIYDSHEFWPGTKRHGRPAPSLRNRLDSEEREIASKATAVVTVSEGAASMLRTHLKANRIVVVRNTFPVNPLQRGPELPSGVVYAGNIAPGRDLETLMAANCWSDEFQLHLIGPKTHSIDLDKKVHLHDKSSLEDVERLLRRLGIGVVPLDRGPSNHDVALPNKLFQAISVGAPVVAADLPEMRKMTKAHGIGELYTPGNQESFESAVRKLREGYDNYLTAVQVAQQELNWKVDSDRLLDLYRKL